MKAILLAALALAGCVDSQTTTTEPTVQGSGHVGVGVTDFRESFANATTQRAWNFTVPRPSSPNNESVELAVTIERAAGDAEVTLDMPSGERRSLASTPSRPSTQTYVPWEEGEYVARAILDGFSGNVTVDVGRDV